MEVPSPQGTLAIAVSAGCAAIHDDCADVAALVNEADSALYSARRLRAAQAEPPDGEGPAAAA
jgi:hypothetical protein